MDILFLILGPAPLGTAIALAPLLLTPQAGVQVATVLLSAFGEYAG